MAHSKRKSLAPGAPLPNTLILPHSPAIRRLISRLSKDSLLVLVLTWLDATRVQVYKPDLTGEDDDDDEEEGGEEDLTLNSVRETYEGYKNSRNVKGKDVVERIVEREWRSGLNLLQIAELDYQYLLDHPSTHKWTAATLHPLNHSTSDSDSHYTPRFHASAFVHALQSLIRPMITAHYFIARHPTLPLTLLRMQLHSPSDTASTLELPGPKRIFYLVFPTNAPGYLYHNIGTSADNLRDIVRSSIASAISRPHARFELRPSNMNAKTLETLVYYRGDGGGEGGMVGAWSVYADGTLEEGPLEPLSLGGGEKRDVEMTDVGEDREEVKRRKVTEGRFGSGAKEGDGKGLESVEFILQDLFPAMPQDEDEDEEFRPTITVKLEGSHVFAGIRSMAESGVGFDGTKMPGWITGEGGVSVGTIRNGKLLKKGR